MDQIAHHWIKSNEIRAAKKGLKLPSSSTSKASALSRPKGLEMTAFAAGGGSRYEDVEDTGGDSSHASDWLDPPTFTVPDSIERDHNVKLYVIEIAIAIHSVIIGFGFGATDTSRGTDIEVLMLAFCFHHFFEGIGLSVAISQSSLDVSMVAKFGIFFAITFPFGVMLGVFSSVSKAQQLLQGLANALAAGILIQASLVEMIAVDFSDERLNGFFLLKSLMFFGLVIGFVAMSSLALLE
jgi:zinc transporter ZupT